MIPAIDATGYRAMSNAESDKKLLLGILVGVGLGLAAATVLVREARHRGERSFFRQARDVAVRVNPFGLERRTERAGRALMKRVDRFRSAGM